MGKCADECAKEYQISREDQDQFAIQSYQKASKARYVRAKTTNRR